MASVNDEVALNRITGNGVTTVFPYLFTILNQADIAVYIDGVLKTLSTHYTLSGVGTQGGGNVTFLSAPANGALVVLFRNMNLARQTDYQANGAFLEATVDADFNRLWYALQQERDVLVTRALRAPLGEAPTDLPAAASRANTFLAFDSLGNPSVSVPIAGTAASVLTDLANSSDANKGDKLVAFKQTGAGAVARTVDAKLAEFVSVKDFGAVGDGVTNDTAAIQALLDSIAMPTRVHFPKGTYIVTTLTIPAALLQQGQVDKGLEFTGDGIGVTILRCNSDVQMFTATCGPGTGGSHLSFRKMTLLRSGLTATNWIVFLKGVALVTFDRVYFWSDDTNTAHETGVYLEGNGSTAPSWEHRFDACRFSGASISLKNTADTWITECQIYPIVADGVSGGRNYGVKIDGGGDIKIRSHLGPAPNGAIWFLGGTANNYIGGCFFDTSANASFLHAIFGAPAYTTFQGNIFGGLKGSSARVTDMIFCQWQGNIHYNCGSLDGGNHHTINMLGSVTGCSYNTISDLFVQLIALTTKVLAISENSGAPISNNSKITDSIFVGGGTGYLAYPVAYGGAGNGTTLAQNANLANITSGADTVAAGATTKVITHGLGQTPDSSAIRILGTGTMGAAKFFWVNTIGATQFTVNVDAAPGGAGWTFAWQAAYRQT